MSHEKTGLSCPDLREKTGTLEYPVGSRSPWREYPYQRLLAGGPGVFYVVGRGLLTEKRVAAWTFWPCDENLNKVEIEGFRFADCTPEKPAPPGPTVGHIWQEMGGRRRTARIDELHDIGFSETARAVLTVLTAEGPGPFKRHLRLCRVAFAHMWGFLRVAE